MDDALVLLKDAPKWDSVDIHVDDVLIFLDEWKAWLDRVHTYLERESSD